MKLLKYSSGGKTTSKQVILDDVDIKNLYMHDLRLAIACEYDPNASVQAISSWTGEDEETVRIYLESMNKKVKEKKVKEVITVPFDHDLELSNMAKSGEKKLRIIALYWLVKDLKVSTWEARKALLSPFNMKIAKELEQYDILDVKKAMERCRDWAKPKNMDWSLQMIPKFVQSIAENK